MDAFPKEFAQFRIRRVSLQNPRPRPCDIEVSSDEGETWKVLSTAYTTWSDDVVNIGLPVQLAVSDEGI